MFGYVVANLDALDAAQKEWYGACYCGLCRAIGDRYGQVRRLALTYDMAFLALLLSSFDEKPPELTSFTCPIHPYKKRKAWRTLHTDYAADMNVLLAFWQRMDRWNDDRNLPALAEARLLRKGAGLVRQSSALKTEAIESGIRALSRCEAEGELNPDLPAGIFGAITAEIFASPIAPAPPALLSFGEALGRFIYLMDAAVDFKKDIRKRHYNPLVAVPSERHEEILTLMMSVCAERFDALDVKRDRALMENILYSGIWTHYKNRRIGGARA